MLKRFLLFVLIGAIFQPITGFAQDSVRVALFPFTITSKQDLSYLQTEIPKMIQSRFSATDIAAVLMGPQPNNAEATLRAAAQMKKCTHALWGSLVWNGNKFNLSALVMATTGFTTPREFSVTGAGIENLLGAVQKLADTISNALVPRKVIAAIRVTGNARIEDEAIKRWISSRAGEPYNPQKLSEDLKTLYHKGYFKNIVVKAADGPKGKIVTFYVTERPTIKGIEFKGNSAIRTDKLKKNVNIHAGSILNIYKIQKNIQRLKLQYQEKNYYSAKITYETEAVGRNQVNLIFVIKEGKKIRIKRITFEGNTAYSSKKLKKMMKTREKGFWSWLTSSGDFKQDMLDRDVAVIEAFYKNHGYINARVANPIIKIKGDWIYLTIKIEEGARYKMGTVGITGDLIVPKAQLMSKLKSPKEKYYDEDVLREDMIALSDVYKDYGYAYAEASPRIRQNDKNHVVDVTFNIKKGKKIYINRIDIIGNTKTRDKVIRRELKVAEKGLYNSAELKRSVKNLNRLSFFKNVKVNENKGPTDNTMDLDFDVTETQTGSLQFGTGYSSLEHLFFTASISQRNFLGTGNALSLQGQLGSVTTQIMLQYIKPWTFDIPLTTSYTAYNWTQIYNYYDEKSMGGAVSASYPFFSEDLRLFAKYSYDVGSLTSVATNAAATIRALTGTNDTSSITVGATYDTRNKTILATRGQNHMFSVEYAGLGGNVGFTKFSAKVGWYIPLFWKFVGFIHGEAGYIVKTPGKILPDYERYYMGGIDSVRGFDYYGIHLYDHNGAEVGGTEMLQGNFELQLPILPTNGVMALAFFDTGQVFDNNFYFRRVDTGTTDSSGNEVYKGVDPAHFDLSQMRKTAGIGIRWHSSMGPIRLEYGWKLDRRPGEDSGKFEFSMSSAF